MYAHWSLVSPKHLLAYLFFLLIVIHFSPMLSAHPKVKFKLHFQRFSIATYHPSAAFEVMSMEGFHLT